MPAALSEDVMAAHLTKTEFTRLTARWWQDLQQLWTTTLAQTANRTCQQCGQSLPMLRAGQRGKPRQFCTSRCKVAAFRARRRTARAV